MVWVGEAGQGYQPSQHLLLNPPQDTFCCQVLVRSLRSPDQLFPAAFQSLEGGLQLLQLHRGVFVLADALPDLIDLGRDEGWHAQAGGEGLQRLQHGLDLIMELERSKSIRAGKMRLSNAASLPCVCNSPQRCTQRPLGEDKHCLQQQLNLQPPVYACLCFPLLPTASGCTSSNHTSAIQTHRAGTGNCEPNTAAICHRIEPYKIHIFDRCPTSCRRAAWQENPIPFV